ncbi:MAG TPA: ribosomal-processing cysteine protease Prp [Candidatus Eisenbergiella intestinipullorum]|nr:ribosomal-processing cysteine protease Prp [Candidatus Eisenbergiella intestinipullorum]
MTTVTIRKNSTGACTGFTCSGHSGYAAAGSDIVCAAVSVLVINTINSIERFAPDEMRVETEEEAGLIEVRFPDTLSREASLLVNSMVLGLTDVQKQYGRKYLKLQFEEV